MTKAQACFERSLAVRPAKSAGASDCLFNLGLVHKVQGREGKAMTCFQRCLAARVKEFGSEGILCAQAQEQIGLLLLEQEEFVKAFEPLKEAYCVYAKEEGERSISSLRVSHVLCFLHRKIEQHIHKATQKTLRVEPMNLAPLLSQSFEQICYDEYHNGDITTQVFGNPPKPRPKKA
jgi:tetratricopeptide (TPR) repeat protein